MFSNGIKEIILISSRIHIMIQLVEDKIEIEEIRVKKINSLENIWGDHISVEKSLTFHKKVRSFFIIWNTKFIQEILDFIHGIVLK